MVWYHSVSLIKREQAISRVMCPAEEEPTFTTACRLVADCRPLIQDRKYRSKAGDALRVLASFAFANDTEGLLRVFLACKRHLPAMGIQTGWAWAVEDDCMQTATSRRGYDQPYFAIS